MFVKIRSTILAILSATALTAGLAVTQAADAVAQDAPSVVGDWEGALAAMGQELTVVFHITEAEDGSLAATLDSPDQGAFGIPCQAPVVDGANVTIPVATVQGNYEGKIAEDGSTIEGTWTQGPNAFPLVLTPVAEESEG